MEIYINHACHPHPLTLRDGTQGNFRCALCKCRGYGSFYRCPSCDFRVHDTCVDCPETFSFFGHPQHQLALYPRADPMDRGRCCDLCRFCIRGVHYGCRLCGMYLHPVCATLPPSSISPVHPQHIVTLVASTSAIGKCASCNDSNPSEGWHYVCAPCGVRLHPWCVFSATLARMTRLLLCASGGQSRFDRSW